MIPVFWRWESDRNFTIMCAYKFLCIQERCGLWCRYAQCQLCLTSYGLHPSRRIQDNCLHSGLELALGDGKVVNLRDFVRQHSLLYIRLVSSRARSKIFDLLCCHFLTILRFGNSMSNSNCFGLPPQLEGEVDPNEVSSFAPIQDRVLLIIFCPRIGELGFSPRMLQKLKSPNVSCIWPPLRQFHPDSALSRYDCHWLSWVHIYCDQIMSTASKSISVTGWAFVTTTLRNWPLLWLRRKSHGHVCAPPHNNPHPSSYLS